MSPASPPPTGTAPADLLTLEFAEPPPASAPPRRPREPRVADPLPVDADGLPGSHGEHLLQRAFGTRDRARRFYDDQLRDRLNEQMVRFVGRMEMAFVATSDAAGECDATLRAGHPGFIRVLDDRHLAYPEYRGNGVMASLGNISENPHVGILMVDFTHDLIGLHVNGRAAIAEDADLRERYPDLPAQAERGRAAERWVLVEVEEAYIHCRKHIPLMRPIPRTRDWGTDDVRRKGGDYFGVRAEARATAT